MTDHTSALFLPADERPRERLLRHGAAVLTDAELLAIMLRTGTARQNAVALGYALLTRFGGLRALLAATPEELGSMPGLGSAKISQLLAVRELGRRALEEGLVRDCALDHPEQVKRYCTAQLADRTVEHCLALYLDNRYRLIVAEEVSRGTLSQTPVYPREIVRAALRHHAAALILAHNHPSGDSRPSAADHALTRQLKAALALVDVRLLDHLVIAGNQAVSLAEMGQV